MYLNIKLYYTSKIYLSASAGFGTGSTIIEGNCAENNGGCEDTCYVDNFGSPRCACNLGFVSTFWEAGCIGIHSFQI